MLDLKRLRDVPEEMRAALARRGADRLVDDVLAADERRRDVIHKIEDLKREQNAVTKEIGRAAPEEREPLLEQAKDFKFRDRNPRPEASRCAGAAGHARGRAPEYPARIGAGR